LPTNKLKGIWAKQIALIAGSFLLGLVLTYYFGFIAGLYETILLGGRERESQIMHGICMRVRSQEMAALTSSIYRKPKG
jgi:hypothetical protein